MNGPDKPAGEKPPKSEEQAEKKNGVDSASIASIGLLVAPLLAALGGLALTGTIGRVQRDAPLGITVAIGLVILAGMVWVAAATFTAPKAEEKRSWPDFVLRSIAFVLAGAGFILALGVGIYTADNEPRPQISPILSEDGRKLTARVTASNLPTNHRLAFRIDLLEDGRQSAQLYQAYVGPNSDGNVDQTITMPLPPLETYTEIGIKAYTGTESATCDDFAAIKADEEYGSGTGCVIITPPQAP